MLKRRTNIESYDDLCIGDKLIIHCKGNLDVDKTLVEVDYKKTFKGYNGFFGDKKNSMYEVIAINRSKVSDNFLITLNMENFDISGGLYNENLFDINDLFLLNVERFFE